MARLDPLIRVRKRTVEDKQKILARLYRELEALEQQDAELARRLETEQALVENTPDLHPLSAFAAYAARVKVQREELAEAIRKLETRVQVAQENLRESFAELKKVEIINRERENVAETARNKKENEALDETALVRFGRRRDDKIH